MCFCLKICVSVEQLKQNIPVCFHIHPLKTQARNALPLCIREIDNLQTFKCKLKCHYFESAFCDV